MRLLIALTQSFRLADPAISIEFDPRALTPEWSEILGRVGVARASLGVPTFDPAVQQAIGRTQPVELIEHCTAILRQAGVTSLNYDMMYGLPGQDRATLANSLERAVALGADRMALFGYAHVPDLLPRQRRLEAAELPGQAERFAMAALGHDLLRAAGYEAIGFDHFARPSDPLAVAARAGMLRRNFQGFTDDASESLIGLGASAISSFPGLLVQNEKHPGRYGALLEGNTTAAARGIRRSAEDRRLGAAIERLLCQGEAALESEFSEEALAELEPFLAADLARLSDDRLIVTPEGLPYARSIAAIFDPYRRTGTRQFSSAV